MTRLSQYFLPTEKQPPADAEALSHKLLVRAGMIRQVGAGLWSWLPAGWRVHQKAVQIVREEIDAIGAHEMLMPVLNPAEIWQRSGRYDAIGDELFRLKDRRGADMVLAMTHEEIVTTHVAQVVRSYRDLPQILYHFQIKERDEPRPRAGVLRTREFIMKDSYTFDRDARGAGRRLRQAPRGLRQDLRPLRAGVVPGRVRRRDDGRHRRARVHGAVPGGRERRRAGARLRGQRRGRERDAEAGASCRAALDAPVEESTPGHDDGRAGLRGARRARGRADQGLPDHRRRGRAAARARPRRPPRQRHQARQRARRGVPAGARGGVRGPDRAGGLHRPGRDRRADPDRRARCRGDSYITGANKADAHLRGVKPGRDFAVHARSTCARSRRATPSTGTRSGSSPRSRSATSSSSARATRCRSARPTWTSPAPRSRSGWAPTASGRRASRPPRSSSSPTRRASRGRARWRRSTCTWSASASRTPRSTRWPSGSTTSCARSGWTSSTTTATSGPGGKFADAELLGCPLRLTVGKRTIAAGEIEAQVRRGRETRSVPLEGAAQAAADLWATLP